jgi:hypothetical protein
VAAVDTLGVANLIGTMRSELAGADRRAEQL